MPTCSYAAHGDHPWPDVGPLVICPGERECGYCDWKTSNRDGAAADPKQDNNAAHSLRKHVYHHHVEGGKKDKSAIVVCMYEPFVPKQRKRNAAGHFMSEDTSAGAEAKASTVKKADPVRRASPAKHTSPGKKAGPIRKAGPVKMVKPGKSALAQLDGGEGKPIDLTEDGENLRLPDFTPAVQQPKPSAFSMKLKDAFKANRQRASQQNPRAPPPVLAQPHPIRAAWFPAFAEGEHDELG